MVTGGKAGFSLQRAKEEGVRVTRLMEARSGEVQRLRTVEAHKWRKEVRSACRGMEGACAGSLSLCPAASSAACGVCILRPRLKTSLFPASQRFLRGAGRFWGDSPSPVF